MSFTIKGKISHYPNNEKVEFSFNEAKKHKKNAEEVFYSSYSLLFEIWKKFKDNDIEIIVKKIK